MIERMKKLTFLVTHREYEGFLEALRQLGVVHVQQLQQGATSAELQAALDLEQRYLAALQRLIVVEETYGQTIPPEDDDFATPATPLDALERVELLQREENGLLHNLDAVEKKLRELEPWGDFDPDRLASLQRESGLQIHFFRCSTKFFRPEWQEQYFAIPVGEEQKRTYFVTFSPEQPDIQAEHIQRPERSLRQYTQERAALLKALANRRRETMHLQAAHRPLLESGRREAQNAISLSRVHLSDERVAGDSLRLLIGWVRADSTEGLTRYLDQNHIFYEMEDPAYEDDVPVQITNGSYSRLFEPILKMYSLPNYKDLDPTVFFAPFFMLFFGLCLGDGGYGLLVLLGGLWLMAKGKGDLKDYGRLGLWLGLSTLVCGLAMGTFFGIDLAQQSWAFLAPVKPYFLNDNGVGLLFGYSPMMVLSVIIGLVQVLLGMVLKGVKAWRNYGFGYAIGTFSWVVVLLAAIVLYGLPACGVPLSAGLTYLLGILVGICTLGIFLYNNPAAYKNPLTGPLLNLGGGIWATYGMATGLLGDLLSYIRLFALGLTGGVLGGVFNTLALDLTASLPWYTRWLPMVLILLAGHGITFALSMISAFVHPMRLTFVEFFKNADFEGGGKAYQPFREIKE